MVVNKIMIKNTTTGQYDTADIGASAENISFDPTGSNLESTDAESAIKETYGAIPENTSQLINDSNFVVSSSLANVATSGSYSDLSNTPSFANVATSGDYDDLSNKPVLATVATSGSYNDLSNTPSIPSIEANPSDTATNTLTKLEVDGTIYNVASGSGGSTVAWNQIQTSTGATKIAEISIDGNSTDVYAPSGGSGSGGHTILDNDGTALTQRDEMQFVGTYSEDDSTNEITKVNIVREMTKAEFDLLSADEKTGIIITTDEETYSGQYGETILLSTPTSLGSGTSITLSDDYTNYDAIYIDFEPVDSTYSNYKNCLIRLTSDIILNVNYDGFSIYHNNTAFGFLYQFTDSDVIFAQSISPSSGDMKINKIVGIKFGGTSSGSDEIYSTDERAVGTWIDGSTIYSKTFTNLSENLTNVNDWNNTSILLDSSIKQIINCKMYRNPNNYLILETVKACGVNAQSYLQIVPSESNTINIIYIEYTKSTT